MRRIRTRAELDLALATTTFLLFIHSRACEISTAIFRLYEEWASRALVLRTREPLDPRREEYSRSNPGQAG